MLAVTNQSDKTLSVFLNSPLVTGKYLDNNRLLHQLLKDPLSGCGKTSDKKLHLVSVILDKGVDVHLKLRPEELGEMVEGYDTWADQAVS